MELGERKIGLTAKGHERPFLGWYKVLRFDCDDIAQSVDLLTKSLSCTLKVDAIYGT